MVYSYSSKVSGGPHWVPGEIVLHDSLNHDEDYLVGTIDGYGGGTYSPTSPITIGGQGLVIGANSNFVTGSNCFTLFGANVLMTQGLEVTSWSKLDGYVICGDTFTAELGATFNDTVLVSGGTTTLNGSLVANGATSFHDSVNFYDAVGFQDEVVMSAGGAIRDRVTNAADADTTYSVTGASGTDVVNIQNGIVTGARTYKISNTANVGNKIEFINWTSFTHTIQNESGGSVGNVAPLSATPGVTRCRYISDGVTARWLMTEKIVP